MTRRRKIIASGESLKKRPQYEYPVLATLTFLLYMIDPQNGKQNSAVGYEIMKYHSRLSSYESAWDEMMKSLKERRPGLHTRVVEVIQRKSSKNYVDAVVLKAVV